MESYSIAVKMASVRNELHILNASQELWAVGLANLLGSAASAFPVAGSYSRSSLNLAAGARTPLSKVTTLCVVLLCLAFLTELFSFIPNACLAAVIFVAVTNLIDIRDFWNAWKYSKKDFATMLVTFIITFLLETSTGLAVGLGFSLFVYLTEAIFSHETAPFLFSASKDNRGIDVVKLEGDLTFLSANRVKDFVAALTLKDLPVPETSSSKSDQIFHRVSSAFDRVLRPRLLVGVDLLPEALILDFEHVRIIDLTGLRTIEEVTVGARAKGVSVVLINTSTALTDCMAKFGIKSDVSSPHMDLDLDEYSLRVTLPPAGTPKKAMAEYVPVKRADVDNNNNNNYSDFAVVNDGDDERSIELISKDVSIFV